MITWQQCLLKIFTQQLSNNNLNNKKQIKFLKLANKTILLLHLIRSSNFIKIKVRNIFINKDSFEECNLYYLSLISGYLISIHLQRVITRKQNNWERKTLSLPFQTYLLDRMQKLIRNWCNNRIHKLSKIRILVF